MATGNRVRKNSRQRPHIPNQEKAGEPAVEKTQVLITVESVDGGPGVLRIDGGRDKPHRQLLLFRALESEMRGTMAFAQRVSDLMKEDEGFKSTVEAYCERRDKEEIERREAQQAKAGSVLIQPTAQDVSQTEATKARG